jgi:MFS family permease
LTTLPSIQEDLGFSDTSLAWVVNAYLLTFAGFLLLSGRLGDLFGGAVLGAPASVGQAGRRCTPRPSSAPRRLRLYCARPS